MIRLRLNEKTEKLREEFSRWLLANPPPPATSDTSLETFVSRGRQWQARLADSRWLAVHWPVEFGGRGLTLGDEATLQEELVRANAPQILGLFGLTMVGPVLIEYGNEAQKKRHLKNILSAKEIWCQGFSEPGAGSDLANIKTRAEVSEDGFSITGQKIWTSFAHVADWCFVLCRTSDEKVKHQGLSYLLVDMKSLGITTRPLRQISGDSEFNEVFFDGVKVPKENLVGGVGEGWKIAISTLMYERVVLTFARHLQSETALRKLILKAERKNNPTLKKALASEIVRACAVRALAYEHLGSYTNGSKPGPEGSLDKLFWSESFQSIAKLAMAFEGTEILSNNEESHQYLYSRGRTIAAGTSEIQRTIIAERLLGMPRLVFS